MIKLQIKLPPPINQTYGISKYGAFYKRDIAKQWEKETLWEIKNQFRGEPLEGKIAIDIQWHLKRDRDVDSGIKIMLDLLQKAGIYKNDKQVCELVVKKNKIKELEPYADITIENVY